MFEFTWDQNFLNIIPVSYNNQLFSCVFVLRKVDDHEEDGKETRHFWRSLVEFLSATSSSNKKRKGKKSKSSNDSSTASRSSAAQPRKDEARDHGSKCNGTTHGSKHSEADNDGGNGGRPRAACSSQNAGKKNVDNRRGGKAKQQKAKQAAGAQEKDASENQPPRDKNVSSSSNDVQSVVDEDSGKVILAHQRFLKFSGRY